MRVLATDATQCDELERLYSEEIALVRRDAACPCYDEERILSRLHARLPHRIRLETVALTDPAPEKLEEEKEKRGNPSVGWEGYRQPPVEPKPLPSHGTIAHG